MMGNNNSSTDDNQKPPSEQKLTTLASIKNDVSNALKRKKVR